MEATEERSKAVARARECNFQRAKEMAAENITEPGDYAKTIDTINYLEMMYAAGVHPTTALNHLTALLNEAKE